MFGKSKKEVKSYEYMVDYCIIGLMTQPTTLHITLDSPLKQTQFNDVQMVEKYHKTMSVTNQDLLRVMNAIFTSYAYMDLAEFKKRLVIIDIEGGM